MSDSPGVIFAKLRQLRIPCFPDPNYTQLHPRPLILLKRALSDQVTGIMPLAGAPQAFQIVEFARSCRKDMNDKIDVVEKDPFAFRASFDVQWTHTLFLQDFFDVVGPREYRLVERFREISSRYQEHIPVVARESIHAGQRCIRGTPNIPIDPKPPIKGRSRVEATGGRSATCLRRAPVRQVTIRPAERSAW